MKILLTGGAGFVGRYLLDELKRLGHDVIVVDPKIHPNSTILNKEYLTRMLKGVDVVYHIGAASGSLWFEDPIFGCKTNNEGTLNLLDESVKAGVKRFIFSSTSSTYVDSPIPHKEEYALSAPNFYSASKIFNEHSIRLYHDLYGMDYIIFRFASVFGAKENKGELNNLITQFVDSIKKGEQPVLYGDGSQTRDFVYVKDVVNALVMGLKEIPLNDTYNISMNKQHTFKSAVELINSILKTNLKPRYIPFQKGVHSKYVYAQQLDNTKLRKCGWVPQFTLKEAIEDAYL